MIDDHALAQTIRQLWLETAKLRAERDATARRLEAIIDSYCTLVAVGASFGALYVVSHWWGWPTWAGIIAAIAVALFVRAATEKELDDDRFAPLPPRARDDD